MSKNKKMPEQLFNELKPNEVTTEQKRSLKVRIITSIIGLSIVLPCIFLGEIPFLVLLILIGGIGAWELVHCAKKHYNITLYILTIVIVLFLATYPLYRNLIFKFTDFNGTIYSVFNSIYASVFLILIGAILCFSLVLIDKNFEVRDACYIFAFGLILGIGIQCIAFLRYYPLWEYYLSSGVEVLINPSYDYAESASLLILVVAGSLFSDTGAYFTGILFGKNKINERISPKKTWEGFVGGTITSVVFVLTFGLVMAACGHPILKIFDINHWYYLLILAIVIPLVSSLGDFIFSSIKRYYGVKDFGFILPGHGGILDRIDSVLFSCISSAILITIFNAILNNNWENLFV